MKLFVIIVILCLLEPTRAACTFVSGATSGFNYDFRYFYQALKDV